MIYICPLCGSGQIHTQFHKNGIPIRRCSSCDFIFAAKEEVIAKRGSDESFYSLDYFQGRKDSGYAAYTGTAATLQANAKALLSKVLDRTRNRGCLLEVGSGACHFLELSAHYFEQVYGIEICADICKRPLPKNAKVFPTSIKHINLYLSDKKATTIVLWDVIEHFQDPLQDMEILKTFSAPSCDLFFTTGNASSLMAQTLKRHWRLMTPLEHYSFFTPKSIRFLLKKVGFHVMHIHYPWKWAPFCLVIAQIERILGLNLELWKIIPPVWKIPLNLRDVMMVHARKSEGLILDDSANNPKTY